MIAIFFGGKTQVQGLSVMIENYREIGQACSVRNDKVTRMEQGTHIEYVIFTITMKQLRP